MSNIFGIIPCFKAKSHWSFVKTNNNSKLAEEVTEKNRISDNTSVGTYIFRDAQKFEYFAKKYIQENQNLEEYYVAPFYQYLINKV